MKALFDKTRHFQKCNTVLKKGLNGNFVGSIENASHIPSFLESLKS